MPSLSDKLKSLGVKVGARDLPKPAEKKPAHPIEEVVDGFFEPTPHGPVFIVETIYQPTYQHGTVGLRPTAPLDVIAAWASDDVLAEMPLEAFAFLDTETTGMAGGSGTYAFMIGVGRFEGEFFRLRQFFMRDPAEEAAQLAALTTFLQPCEALVTFNGKSFDAPLVSNRYIANGSSFPLTDAPHIDLLHLARRLWRDRLPRRNLGALEVHILGMERSEEDTPGWLIPTLYFDYLRKGDARPLKGTFYHNALDVVAMAALLNQMAYMLSDPCNGAVQHALDLVAIGKLFEALGALDVAAEIFAQGLERTDLPEESYWATQERLSFVHRRRGDYKAAVQLWELAAEGRQLYAHIELAKYHEHQARNYQAARQWTLAALELLAQKPRARWRQERKKLLHRLARLESKLAR